MFNRKIVRAPVVAATNLTKGILLKPQIGTIEDDNKVKYHSYATRNSVKKEVEYKWQD